MGPHAPPFRDDKGDPRLSYSSFSPGDMRYRHFFPFPNREHPFRAGTRPQMTVIRVEALGASGATF